MRRLLLAALFVGCAAVPALGRKPAPGDAQIRGRAGPSDIVVTTTSRLAGAIHSVTWLGKEFIDSADHGRQLQSASSFDAGHRDFWAEAYNPTEAGSRRDGPGPRSSSQLAGITAKGNTLSTVTRMAFWLAPGEASGRYPARNPVPVSNHVLTKQVTVGYKGFPHAIDYRVTFGVPAGERHTLAQFEALTGYMPAEFEKFWTLDVRTGALAPLSDGPGEQGLPVVFGTANGMWAMGVWSPDLPGPAGGPARYGRFRFPDHRVVKWNCVFRVRDGKGVKPGDYSYRMFVAVGSLQNVKDTLVGVANDPDARR